MEKWKIDRINELAHKKKTVGLTEAELTEQAALRRSDDPNRDFTRLWVCKESFLKALGTGLEQPMNSFCVRLDAHSAVLEQTISPKAWKLTEYQQGDYYIAVCEEYAERRNQS